MTTLLVWVTVLKVTLLFLAGLIALLTTRRATAGMRHLLCVCTLAGSLILPLALLLPTKTLAFRLTSINAAVARSQAIGRSSFWPSSNVLLAIWAIGTALLLLRLGIGYWRIRRAIYSAAPVAPGMYACDVTVPIAIGLLRPVVLMPRAAAEWPDWQRAAAVRHERAHIERGDLTANFIAHAACAVWWFHPLVWFFSAALRREQETACDDAVLHSGFEPATYAQALLAVAQNSTPTLFQTTGCAMATQIDVKSRIMRLLDRSIARTTSPATLRYAAIAFAGLVLAIGIPVRAQEPYHAGGDVTSPSVAQKVEPQYTEEARKAKISGPVLLSLTVGVDGMAHDISVKKSLDSGLDRMAVEAVQQWHFNPGTLKGQPVPVLATIEINFRLQ
jgi:TonB family protein